MTKLAHIDACRGLSARPLHPFGSSSENNAYGTASPIPRRSRRVRPRRKISPRLNARTKKRKPHTPRRFRFPIYFRG